MMKKIVLLRMIGDKVMSRVLKLFENKLSIEIPDNYTEIQDEENIFASSEKPNYILKNDTLDSYITITKSTIEMKDSLELTLQGLYNQFGYIE